MAEYTANAPQTVAIGGNVVFNDTVHGGGCAITHRDDSGIFTLHGGRYDLTFGANITGTTADVPVSLAFAIAGEPILTSTMIVTPSAANELNNVFRAVSIVVPCNCCYNVAVENVGTTAATVQNATLIITKE